MKIRSITKEEQLYVYSQSVQIEMQSGHIGYLRGDFGNDGKSFSTTWFDSGSHDKSDTFKTELDEVINRLRSSEYGLLKSRGYMQRFLKDQKGGIIDGGSGKEYGIRIDTEKYAYLLRCNPMQGYYCCYCYERKWLDSHMKRAENGIRFINPLYKELFRLADGDKIRITDTCGETCELLCRYIDETHLEVGDDKTQLYHICEFAELMERNGNTVIPLRSSLPEECYGHLGTCNEVILIKRGESGYYKTGIFKDTPQSAANLANDLNEELGVSKAQAKAMSVGSMFGWEVPAADPKNYDKSGNHKNQRKQNQRDSR